MGVSQIPHSDGVPVIAIDECPTESSEWMIALSEPEPGEREAAAAEVEWFVGMMESLKARVG